MSLSCLDAKQPDADIDAPPSGVNKLQKQEIGLAELKLLSLHPFGDELMMMVVMLMMIIIMLMLIILIDGNSVADVESDGVYCVNYYLNPCR